MAREVDAVLAKQIREGGPTPRPSPQQARIDAALADVESLSWVQGDEDNQEQVVALSDVRALLATLASEASEGGVTGVWPHTPSRLPSTAQRLRMPMDLPVFGELKRPKRQVDPDNPRGYILSLDCFPWGREVIVRLVEEDIVVFVKDALATRKVYAGKRKDEGDPYRHKNGR